MVTEDNKKKNQKVYDTEWVSATDQFPKCLGIVKKILSSRAAAAIFSKVIVTWHQVNRRAVYTQDLKPESVF
jgi:hypothetical protein